ncbi:MAG: hypothetical protein ABI145_20405 [Steroidobacteraceae bacterium]
MRTALAGQRSELLGNRIVELPESESGLRNRDAHSGFIAYVPEGSPAKGKFLVTRANERGVDNFGIIRTASGAAAYPPRCGPSRRGSESTRCWPWRPTWHRCRQTAAIKS